MDFFKNLLKKPSFPSFVRKKSHTKKKERRPSIGHLILVGRLFLRTKNPAIRAACEKLLRKALLFKKTQPVAEIALRRQDKILLSKEGRELLVILSEERAKRFKTRFPFSQE